MSKEKRKDQIGDGFGVDVIVGCGLPSTGGVGIEVQGEERTVLFCLSPGLLKDPDRFRSSFCEFLGYAEDIVKGDVSGPERDALRSLVEHIRARKYDGGSRRRGHLR